MESEPLRSQLPMQTYIWQAHGTVLLGFGVALVMAVVVYWLFPETWPEFALTFAPRRLASVSFEATGSVATFLIMLFVYLGWVAWFNRAMHALAERNFKKVVGVDQ